MKFTDKLSKSLNEGIGCLMLIVIMIGVLVLPEIFLYGAVLIRDKIFNLLHIELSSLSGILISVFIGLSFFALTFAIIMYIKDRGRNNKNALNFIGSLIMISVMALASIIGFIFILIFAELFDISLIVDLLEFLSPLGSFLDIAIAFTTILFIVVSFLKFVVWDTLKARFIKGRNSDE